MSESNELDRRYVRAALRAFSRRGYFGTTMNHIADEAGVSQPRVSQVFTGKRTAYLAAHRLSLTIIEAAFRAHPPTASEFDTDQASRIFRELQREHPEAAMMLLHTVTSCPADPRLSDCAKDVLTTLTALLMEVHHASASQAREFIATNFLMLILSATDVTEDDDDNLRSVAHAS